MEDLIGVAAWVFQKSPVLNLSSGLDTLDDCTVDPATLPKKEMS